MRDLTSYPHYPNIRCKRITLYISAIFKEKKRKVEGKKEEEKCAGKTACHCDRLETKKKSPSNLLDSLVTAAERLAHELSSQILVCNKPYLQFWRLFSPFISVYDIRIPQLSQEVPLLWSQTMPQAMGWL